MKTNVSDVLRNITKIRKLKGFSQEYVAQKIGLKQSGYGMIESGTRELKVEFLLQIAIVLEVDVIDFFISDNSYSDNHNEVIQVHEPRANYFDKDLLIESLKMNVELLTEKLKKYEETK